MARKSKESASVAVDAIQPLPKPPTPRVLVAIAVLVWPALFVVGGYLAWSHWGAQRLMQEYGTLQFAQIRVTPQPAYIRTNVAQQVYQDAGLGSLSLLSPNASAQIAHAFETSPWVLTNSVRVSKLPDGMVEVQLRYRTPVAMIPVESRHPEVAGAAFFAVDQFGVLLPAEDFAPKETQRYLHILIPEVYPASGIGSAFGDPRVLAAAQLAGLLAPYRDELGIAGVEVADASNPQAPLLAMVLRGGERVIWGSVPGRESADEATAAVKLERLLQSRTPGGLDLRNAALPRDRPDAY